MKKESKSKTSSFLVRALRLVESVSFWGVAVCSVASLLHADQFRLGMLLTYSPRLFWLMIATFLFFKYAIARSYRWSLLMSIFALLLIWDMPLGLGRAAESSDEVHSLTLLSFNTGAEVDHAEQLSELCVEEGVEILSLQEVSSSQREVFANAFPEFHFFHGDESAEFENAEPRVFSSLIGIKKNLLSSHNDVEVFTRITGYRTFAIKARLNDGRFLRVANVHTTKPFTIYYGLQKLFSNAARKAARHQNEKELLDVWLAQDAETPTIIAGDFNAPASSSNLRFEDMFHSHRKAGSGLHLTYPRSFPFIGIDHIVTSEHIVFTTSEIVDAGFSDHRAQIATFQLKKQNPQQSN